MLSAALGLALLTGVRPAAPTSRTSCRAGVLAAFGLGLSLVPATIAAVQGVSAAESGLASGVLRRPVWSGARSGSRP